MWTNIFHSFLYFTKKIKELFVLMKNVPCLSDQQSALAEDWYTYLPVAFLTGLS